MSKKIRAGLRLEAMALDIPDVPGHPNRTPFSGVLARLDAPSDRAPAGAAGHRVLLPRAVAERALPSLLGMAVDYAPGLQGHDARRKIGIITRAEIAGDELQVSGYLFARDFPDVVRDLRTRRGRLGMSYEVTQVRVADPAAEIWALDHIVFTGAAILERAAAAYQTTSLAANSAVQFSLPYSTQGDIMDEKLTQALEQLAQTNQALLAEFARLRGELDAMRQQDSLRAETQRFAAPARKTVTPQVLTLLAKTGVGAGVVGSNGQIDVPVLDKALEGLPVEQRIAVKSQLARAGAID